MANERGNSEITATFDFYGGVARKVQDASYINKERNPNALRMPTRGQSDYVAILPRPLHLPPLGLAIEAKADRGTEHFSFSEINPDQRDWLDRHHSFAWIWLWMGGGRAPNGRSAYLTPWILWLGVEADFKHIGGLDGMAWKVPQQIVHREAKLYADWYLSPYRLEWQSGHWIFPEGHAIWNM